MPDSKPQWTPGTWTVYDRGIGWEVIGCDGQTINHGFRETFSKPDACLIAAAPDLYTALEALIDAGTRQTREQFTAARDALLKANPQRAPEASV